MRTAFVETLMDAAAGDPRIWLITGDLGFSVIEPFAEKFSERFVNAGVQEQNMTGIAAGLALAGNIVFTYSIANFSTLRCIEQIRNDVCYHNLNVKIVSVGAGFAYGAQGYTHHGIEDIAVLRALPSLRIASPADAWETRMITRSAVTEAGPMYLRLGKGGEPVFHTATPTGEAGRMVPLIEGRDVLLIATGAVVGEAVQAASKLAEFEIAASVWSCPWIVPFDEAAVLDAASKYSLIVTVEEGRSTGGLGGAVAETLAGMSDRIARLIRLGAPKELASEIGSQTYLRSRAGLDCDAVASTVFQHFDKVNR